MDMMRRATLSWRGVFCIISILAGIFLSMPAGFAQDALSKYNEYFGADGANGNLILTLSTLRSALYRVLEAVLLIGGLSTLLMAVLNLIQGEKSGIKRMFLWGIGLMIGFGLLAIFASHGGVYAGSSRALARAGSFASIKETVGTVLSMLMSILSMVSSVIVSIHMMKGERDGVEKAIKYFILSLVGLLLLNIV